MKKIKELTLSCGCYDKRCGKLLILKMSNKNIEINFIPYRHKKAKEGVIIKDRDYDKFIKFLEL